VISPFAFATLIFRTSTGSSSLFLSGYWVNLWALRPAIFLSPPDAGLLRSHAWQILRVSHFSNDDDLWIVLLFLPFFDAMITKFLVAKSEKVRALMLGFAMIITAIIVWGISAGSS
jgi:hypothetical protein